MTETRRTCVLAAAHLTASTWNLLRISRADDWPVLGGVVGPDMLICWVPTDWPAHDLPADLEAALRWAQAQPPAATATDPGGFEYVLFDLDAAPVDGLALYDGDALRQPPAPPAPWKARAAEFWAQAVGHDCGGQRMRIVDDARGAPVAWVVADEDDEEGAAALALIEAAPEIAQRYAALVKVVREMGAEIKAHDDRLNDGVEGDGPKAPDGDDYNEIWSTATTAVEAAERIIAGR